MGYIFLAISILGFGLSNCLWVFPLRYLSVWQVIFCRSFFNVLFIFSYCVFIIAFGGAEAIKLINYNNVTFATLFKCMLLCCYSYFGLVFYNLSLKNKTLVSVAVPLTCISAVFGSLVSYFVFNATLTPIQVIIFLLFSFAVFILENKNFSTFRFNLSKGPLFALSAAFVWGTSFAMFPEFINSFGAVFFSLVLEMVVCTFSLLILALKYRSVKTIVEPFNFLPKIVPISVFGCIGLIFTNISTQHLPINTIFAFEPLTPVISILGGIILLKERLRSNQIVAVAIIIMGLLIIKVF